MAKISTTYPPEQKMAAVNALNSFVMPKERKHSPFSSHKCLHCIPPIHSLAPHSKGNFFMLETTIFT
jgi:hypothetical protein